MSDLKTSLLVNRQVPEFVREEHPLFITFLEAYYEFLENKQGSQKNDLIAKAKDLRYISDVDFSIDEFEDSFFNTYASLFPKDVAVDKEFLIKNVLPVYLAKGNEKSFKLLFRLLFGSEVEVIYPKNDVLRASDGKWIIDNILRIERDVRSVYVGDGSNTTFYLAQTVNSGEITVYIDGVLKTEGTDFYIRRETRKLIFITPPALNSTIKVFYNEFNVSVLNNRRIKGKISGATAIVENAVPRIITDTLNFGFPFELFINKKTLLGEFLSGESITTDLVAADGSLINLEADGFSIVTKITVVDGGAGYNVGDPVIITGGNFTQRATAEIGDVASGSPTRIVVTYGGAGFQVTNKIFNVEGTAVNGEIDIVDTSGINSRSTFSFNNDLISNYASVLVSSSNYGFPSTVIPAGENVNTRLCDALSYITLNDLGPITNGIINIAAPTTSSLILLDSDGPSISINSNTFLIKSVGSIGRIDINNGGSGYKVGDEILFHSNPPGTYGYGAAAAVKQVDGTGKITRIEIQPQRINGTANILNNSVQIIGTNTNFLTDFAIGDKIVIRSQERYINAISSDTQANVNVSFNFANVANGTIWANNSYVGHFAKGPVGGINYVQGNFPNVSVLSYDGGGIGANVQIRAVMGDGEIVKAASDFLAGEILSIRLLSGGAGYQYIPLIDLSQSGDGSATAAAEIANSYFSLPGRWISSDSIISNSERRLQGANYFVDYSYVTSSSIEFAKYKNILKSLLHPAGFVNYALFEEKADIETNTRVVFSDTPNTISGFVNVYSGSIFVTGTNTKFNIANTKGILTIGSNVAVNGEIRTINSIISNTNIRVSSAFTNTANSQTLYIIV